MLRRKGLLHAPSHDANESPMVDDALQDCRRVGRFEGLDA